MLRNGSARSAKFIGWLRAGNRGATKAVKRLSAKRKLKDHKNIAPIG
eukprot:CAMPEP_0115551426 /NCGR_PEP_ID=MMETSP0271-20121206/95725_1 /TAXON_ID=71861 /ORGANISM="Scrippsiella trochoidea, Strain CCMP3099" /LENGTH=46 /DNA_ID= /DNA_START= /DNA_END= /DNA_ORIENTATION=